MSNDDDLYSDLPEGTTGDYIKKLEIELEILQLRVKELDSALCKSEREQKKLSHINNVLQKNISSLYKTARSEIERKENTIHELRDEYENMAFRRRDHHNQRYDSNPRRDDTSRNREYNQPHRHRHENVRSRYEDKKKHHEDLNHEKIKSPDVNYERNKVKINLGKSIHLESNHERSRSSEYGYERNKTFEFIHDKNNPPEYTRERNRPLEYNNDRNRTEYNYERNKQFEYTSERIRPEFNHEKNKSPNYIHERNKPPEHINPRNKTEPGHERNKPFEYIPERIKPEFNHERNRSSCSNNERIKVPETTNERNRPLEHIQEKKKPLEFNPSRRKALDLNRDRIKPQVGDLKNRQTEPTHEKTNPEPANERKKPLDLNQKNQLAESHHEKSKPECNQERRKPSELHQKNQSAEPQSKKSKPEHNQGRRKPSQLNQKHQLPEPNPEKSKPEHNQEKGKPTEGKSPEIKQNENSTVEKITKLPCDIPEKENPDVQANEYDELPEIKLPENFILHFQHCEQVPYDTPRKIISGEIVGFPFKCPLKLITPIRDTPDCLKEKLKALSEKECPVVPMLNEFRKLEKQETVKPDDVQFIGNAANVTPEEPVSKSSFSVLSVDDAEHGEVFSQRRKKRKRPLIYQINVKKVSTSC